MDILRSEDNLVTKYHHDDHSETAIKTVLSYESSVDSISGEIINNPIERNKYSLFISSSSGCYMKCSFCYLTLKEMPFTKLNEKQILDNLKQAIQKEAEIKPEIRDKYIKISWMGMGDAITMSKAVKSITIELLNWIMSHQYAKGLDGVDLSTVMPNMKNNAWADDFQELDDLLNLYPKNPQNKVVKHYDPDNLENYYLRSNFRLFYSLHSAVQQTRDSMIPNALPIDKAIEQLKEYSIHNKYNVIYHYLFIADENDSNTEIDALIDLIKQTNIDQRELRVLRYNQCLANDAKESDGFKEIIKKLVQCHTHIKVQISAGKEIQSACGQFLVRFDD